MTPRPMLRCSTNCAGWGMGVELVELELHVNDPEFATAMVAKLDEYMGGASS